MKKETENNIEILQKGQYLVKLSKRSKQHKRQFRLECTSIVDKLCQSKSKIKNNKQNYSRKKLALFDINRIQYGATTSRFKKFRIKNSTLVIPDSTILKPIDKEKRQTVLDIDQLSFSIITSSLNSKSLDILCSSQEQRDKQVKTLKYCVNRCKMTHESDILFVISQQNLFDKNDSGYLTKTELFDLFKRLNFEKSEAEIDVLFNNFDTNNNDKIEFEEFLNLFASITHRSEFLPLFNRYCKLNSENKRQIKQKTTGELLVAKDDCKDVNLIKKNFSENNILSMQKVFDDQMKQMSIKNFIKFIQIEQCQPEFTFEMCHRLLIELFPFKSDYNQIDYNDFVQYLTSEKNHIIEQPKANAEHEIYMNHPLTDYFIASSHNTYLEGNQYSSKSSVQKYIDALHLGCKCLELDCQDGSNGEPIIYHGQTLTSKILFRDVVVQIRKYGFVCSPYPVILSLENHCCELQQIKMASILIEVFGDSLATHIEIGTNNQINQVNNIDTVKERRLDSPEQLKYKFIIKSSNRSIHELIKLLYLQGVKLHKNKITTRQSNTMISSMNCYEMISLNESKIDGAETNKKLRQRFLHYNQKLISRIYPSKNRVLSGNFNPTLAWSLGCQMVAMNYQVCDIGMCLNIGRFANSLHCKNCYGYLLKPKCLLKENFSSNIKKRGLIDRLRNNLSDQLFGFTLALQVMSGQNLFCSASQTSSEIIVINKASVEVSVYRNSKNITHQTEAIENNGYVHIQNKKIKFHIKEPQLSMILFRVFDGQDSKIKNLIGYNSFSLDKIRHGYRFVPLRNLEHEIVLNSGLFVHINKISSAILN